MQCIQTTTAASNAIPNTNTMYDLSEHFSECTIYFMKKRLFRRIGYPAFCCGCFVCSSASLSLTNDSNAIRYHVVQQLGQLTYVRIGNNRSHCTEFRKLSRCARVWHFSWRRSPVAVHHSPFACAITKNIRNKLVAKLPNLKSTMPFLLV